MHNYIFVEMAHQYQATSTNWILEAFGNFAKADSPQATFHQDFLPRELEPVVPLVSYGPQPNNILCPYCNAGPRQQIQQQIPDMRPVRISAAERIRRRRDPISLTALVGLAIMCSSKKRLTVRGIFEWIEARDPNLCDMNEAEEWRIQADRWKVHVFLGGPTRHRITEEG